jgi:hypothetical protein
MHYIIAKKKEWLLSKLLDDLKETRWKWELETEALDRNLWRTHFGSGQTTELIN